MDDADAAYAAGNSPEEVAALKIGADQGHVDAQLALGFMYHNGQGVPQDYKQAVV